MKNYISFEPAIQPETTNENDMYFLFDQNRMMVKKGKKYLDIIRYKDIANMNIKIDNVQYMGKLNGENCFSAGIKKTDSSIDDSQFMDLKSLMLVLDESLFLVASKSYLLLNWEKTHKYCGVCGFPMKRKESLSERALICPKCGYTTWPRTSPAIIVAVTKGDKLLLAHNKNFSHGMYSVIAGFVELGETFEQCVKREAFEEVGIQIDNIKYFGSQPWPFPNSMMVGFTAEYSGGQIVEDGKEIVHADWFSKDEIPGMYRESKSIGSELIKWFIETH